MPQRRNQQNLSQPEWNDFIAALDAIRTTEYPRFVQLHEDAMKPANMNWRVHSMDMDGSGTLEVIEIGRNFLAWHRLFLYAFERTLQQVRPSVTLPYWDWSVNREIPQELRGATFRSRWGITRASETLPLALSVNMTAAPFSRFQLLLETDAHNTVHRVVGGSGGTMGTASSPQDPIFWLHHANIDRLWAQWQASPVGSNPTNLNTELRRRAFFRAFGRNIWRVRHILDTRALNYWY